MELDRYRGSLLGLAIGDAVGTTLEFCPPESLESAQGGPLDFAPGKWTDDTSMALCLAESLLQCSGFNAKDQLDRYVRWMDEGYYSSTGRCFDLGGTTSDALFRYKKTKEEFCGSEDILSAGNGSIMRLAPVVLFYAFTPKNVYHYAALSSRTTHQAREAIDACRLFAHYILGALQGMEKTELLGKDYVDHCEDFKQRPLTRGIHAIACGSYRLDQEIVGSGYVVESLQAALWAFNKSTCFEDGLFLAVNLGHDADTTGAVYGQLAGAYYGLRSIPTHWVKRVYLSDLILSMAGKLYEEARKREGDLL